MSDVKPWNVRGASTLNELDAVLLIAAGGLKTQVLESPVLSEPRLAAVRDRLSAIADELNSMTSDIYFPPSA